MNSATNTQLYKKILLLGVNNGGKTSILLTLRKNCNILSYLSLKPTKKINIEEFKYESEAQGYSIWDFGGQEQYRDEYIANFDKYVKGADKIIYVIDVQDIPRFEVALNYFSDIVHVLKVMEFKVEFSIFLHKYDPNLKNQEQFKEIDVIINSQLIDKIKQIIPKGFEYNIYKTSIYAIFDKSSW